MTAAPATDGASTHGFAQESVIGIAKTPNSGTGNPLRWRRIARRDVGEQFGYFCILLATRVFVTNARTIDGVVGPDNCNESGFASVLAAI